MIKVPDKFQNDLKVVRSISEQVCVHHDHLEGMMLMSILADIGNRAMFFVGVPDTGKSRCAEVVRESSKRQVINPHGLTANGLKYYQEKLSNSSTTVIVEDLSRSGTEYMQIQTISVLAGLSYTGYLAKHNQSIQLDLDKVKMAALIYGQPLILRKIVSVDEFDSDIRDKCPRYYHLFRPTDPYPKPLEVTLTYFTLDRKPVSGQSLDDGVITNLRHVVSKGRAIEHGAALVEASARLNQREEVSEADKWLVRGLTNNLKLETVLFRKQDLEGPRSLNVNLIPVFTAWMSFKQEDLTVKYLGMEFGVSEKRTREILAKMGQWCYVNSNHVYPSKESKDVMKEIQFDGGES